ncbi:MAG: hypothetical protein IJW18_08185 [Lachnospiraceae bacterium]|nr:hypothetical protein [Lachnospiraceae bacterium]
MIEVLNSLFNYLICFILVAAVGYGGIMLGKFWRKKKNEKEALKGNED